MATRDTKKDVLKQRMEAETHQRLAVRAKMKKNMKWAELRFILINRFWVSIFLV